MVVVDDYHDHPQHDKNNDNIIFRKPIFNNTEIPVPHCTETYPAQPLVGEVCNVNEVSVIMVVIMVMKMSLK